MFQGSLGLSDAGFLQAARHAAPAAVLQVPRQSPIAAKATMSLNPQAWEEDERPGPKSKADRTPAG